MIMKPNTLTKLANYNILLIQDNKSCNDIVYNLFCGISNNKLIQTVDKEEILSSLSEKHYDIVIMDFRLTKYSSIELIKSIRTIDIMIPIILLASKEDEAEVCKGVNLLIEGLILKPITHEGLIEGVKNSIKRLEYLTPTVFHISQSLSYLHDTHELIKDGKVVSLAKKEAQLLELLMNNIGRIVPIHEIEWKLWDSEEVGLNALKSVVQRLRKVIGKKHIKSHSGIGYSLDRRNS